MRGNSFGKLFSVTTFGESHGPGLGAVIDGVPGGLDFSMEELKSELKKKSTRSTARYNFKKRR